MRNKRFDSYWTDTNAFSALKTCITMDFEGLKEEKSAKEVYGLYKKRWTIETFYNYFKSKADFNALYEGDYYKTQGLAFIMLVVGLIQRAMETAVNNVNGKSVSSCLLDARMVKICKRQGVWTICNVLNKQKTLFEQLNTPLTVVG